MTPVSGTSGPAIRERGLWSFPDEDYSAIRGAILRQQKAHRFGLESARMPQGTVMLRSIAVEGSMTSPRSHRLALYGAAMAVTIVLTGSVAIGDAAAVAPKLVAKPATGLVNGKTVKVTGSGFTPNDQVFLVECLAVATGQGQCDISTATPATITAKGILPPTYFTVVTGKIGNKSCGTKQSNLKGCVINAGNAAGGDTATTPIAFKMPKKARKKK